MGEMIIGGRSLDVGEVFSAEGLRIHHCRQYSAPWWNARIGLLTASGIDSCITAKRLEVSASLKPLAALKAWEMYAGVPIDRNAKDSRATRRGHELEPRACDAYQWLADEPGALQPVGFVTDADRTLGCSPDRLVRRAGGLEVKCPELKEYLRVLIHHEETGALPAEYVPQVQCSLLVTCRRWWDSIFYHPSDPDHPVIVRTLPDPLWQTTLLPRAVCEFNEHRDYILTVLRARRCRVDPDAPPVSPAGALGPAIARLEADGLIDREALPDALAA